MDAPAEIITVIARWQVREGHLGDVLAHVAGLRTATLAEPGCLGYDVFRAIDAPDTLLLVERYRDADAVQAHRETAHYRDVVVGRILPLLESRHIDLLQARIDPPKP